MRSRLAIGAAVAGLGLAGAGGVAEGQANQPVPPRAAKNARVARRDVHALLAKLVFPAGATPAARNPGGSALASAAFVAGSSALIDIHRFWRVPGEDPAAVLSWFKAHAPAGSSLTTSGSGSGPGYSFTALGFSFANVAGVLESRELGVSIATASGGGTAIRADAEDVYWVPRPKWEKVPPGVNVIDVTVQRFNPQRSSSTTITDPTKIAKTVSLVDALAPAQPGVVFCPADFGPSVTLRFVSAPDAAPLATVVGDGSGCGGISFALRGKQAPGLTGGFAFVPRIERLAGLS
jgi:hypothetical protein